MTGSYAPVMKVFDESSGGRTCPHHGLNQGLLASSTTLCQTTNPSSTYANVPNVPQGPKTHTKHLNMLIILQRSGTYTQAAKRRRRLALPGGRPWTSSASAAGTGDVRLGNRAAPRRAHLPPPGPPSRKLGSDAPRSRASSLFDRLARVPCPSHSRIAGSPNARAGDFALSRGVFVGLFDVHNFPTRAAAPTPWTPQGDAHLQAVGVVDGAVDPSHRHGGGLGGGGERRERLQAGARPLGPEPQPQRKHACQQNPQQRSESLRRSDERRARRGVQNCTIPLANPPCTPSSSMKPCSFGI